MLTLPISLIVSLILAFLLVRLVRGAEQSPPFLVALLLACAIQGTVVALVQHYGVAPLRLWQPMIAVIIPPLAWLAFQQAVLRAIQLPKDMLHVASPVVMMICLLALPVAIDVVLVSIFLIYGSAILVTLSRSSGDLPLAPLGAGNLPTRVWQMIAIALIASALSDVLISLALIWGQHGLPPLILSVFSSLALLAIGGLGLTSQSHSSAEQEETISLPNGVIRDDVDPDQAQRNKEIMAQLNRLIRDHHLYLDPELTLVRLARRLSLPSKQLSIAVNQQAEENVSRYINAFRIDHACGLLREGQSVTHAMLNSGFNTKSNFNREFTRITGLSPTQWRKVENV